MKGLVGFFDILGYQSFLENNSASESALEVLRIINELPEKARLDIKAAIKEEKKFEGLHDALDHLVFSDTIVFTLTYPEHADDDWIYLAQGYLAICAAGLTANMFAHGLPLRGVIHEGDFLTKEHCLAGKAVVEAYQQCASLDFAGLVLSKELGRTVTAAKTPGSVSNDSDFLFSYLSPMRDGSETKLLQVNWLKYLGEDNLTEFKQDAENFVLGSFWAHQKDCPKAADRKMQNTVKLMRKMLQNDQFEKSKEQLPH